MCVVAVQSAAAREGGLDVSLFKLLSDAHPQAVAALQTQVRHAHGAPAAASRGGLEDARRGFACDHLDPEDYNIMYSDRPRGSGGFGLRV